MRLTRLLLPIGLACLVLVSAATAAGTHAAGKTTITFWDAYSSDGPEVKHLEKVIIPAFEKSHPGIEVKDVTIPYDDLHQKLVTAVAGSQLPDLVRSDIIWVPELAHLGVLQPLDQVMPDFKAYKARVFPGPLETNYYKGHYYGMPLDTNTRIWIYNPTTLSSLGMNGPPKTFAQFRSMAQTAKAKGVDLYAELGTSGWNFLPWIWSGGGSLTNKTYTKATGYLNSPKSVAAIQMLVDMKNAGEIPDPTAAGTLGTYDGIHNGKYGSMLDGPWAFSILNSQYPNMKLDGTTLPAGAGGSVSVVGGEDIVLTRQSKHQQAALAFMRYMLGSFAQKQMARAGQMPILKSSTAWLTKIHPYYATYLKQIATARPRTPSPQWPKIDQVLTTQIAKAFKGEPVQQALTEAAQQIDGLLAQS